MKLLVIGGISFLAALLLLFHSVALGLLVIVYFTPIIIAMIRDVPNQGSVAIVNIFLGWTFIGWVVALAMAARSVPATPGVKREHNSFRLTKNP